MALYHFLPFEVKIFKFWPKTMDYNPWFDFWQPKSFEKSMPIRARKEKSNDACFSCVAPSSREL